MEFRILKNMFKKFKAKYFNELSTKALAWKFLAVFLLLLCWLLLFNTTAVSQTIKGSYTLFNRDCQQVKNLLGLLRQDWSEKVPEKALACFFGKNVVYDAELATLLVFIDKTVRDAADNSKNQSSDCLVQDKSVKIALLKKGKVREELFGQKYVHVIVFVAEKQGEKNSVGKYICVSDPAKAEKTVAKLTAKGTVEITREITQETKQKEPVSLSLSSVDSRPSSGEFFLYSLVRAVVNIISGAPLEKGETSATTTDIKNIPLKMFLVGNCCETAETRTNLYYGIYKIAISENSIARVTVQEEYEDKSNPHQTKETLHLATFGNYSGSRITSSLGLMGIYSLKGFCKDNTKKSIKYEGLDAFAFGHVYIKRPQLPPPRLQNRCNFCRRISWSFVAGTRISKSLFDDVFLGVSVGHFISTVGFIVGVDFRKTTTTTTTTTTVTTKTANTDTVITTPLPIKATQRNAYFCLGWTLMF